MSDEEETYEEEAEVEAVEEKNDKVYRYDRHGSVTEEDDEEEDEEEAYYKPKSRPPPREPEVQEMTEAEKAIMAAKKKHQEEDAERMRDYEEQRAIQREKEEEELRELKEKQERRRAEREEEEAKFAEMKSIEEDRRRAEEDERKRKYEAEKKRKEAERLKKQQMMAGAGLSGGKGKDGPNFVVKKKNKDGTVEEKPISTKGAAGKEDLEAAKLAYMEQFKVPLDLDSLGDCSSLRGRIKDLHSRVCKLEAAKYDLEQRTKSQEYDLRELTERQKQMARQKALKKGEDPDAAAVAKHPGKVSVASKYDRQTDRRSYGEKTDMYAHPPVDRQKALFHGTARPPEQWGRKMNNDELEQLRKTIEPPKYQEAVKVEGAKPPVPIIPSKLPEESAFEEGDAAPPPPAAAAPPPAEAKA